MVLVVDHRAGLSDYVAEMLRAWGLCCVETCAGDALPGRPRVAIVPAGASLAVSVADDFVRAGGTLMVMEPDTELAQLAGLERGAALDMPRRLRLAAFRAAGFVGEAPPIVGTAREYGTRDPVQTLAYLVPSEDGTGEHPAILRSQIGAGTIISVAFDLPRSVLLLRQGDPRLAGQIPLGDACCRPSHLAVHTGLHDAGWLPYADLLARLLTDLVAAHAGMPVPLLDPMPAEAPALLLYSGDEDSADPAAVREELDFLSRHGARMDLNIIPGKTCSSPEEVRDYAQRHDLNPHPDLRPLDGHALPERLAELERQIRLFETTYGIPPASLRTHCTAWCGYTEQIEVLERCGVRMDSTYVSGCYLRRRDLAPYNPFGGALPLRFCTPDGHLLDVHQQHTHIMDDMHFAPDTGCFRMIDYSYRLTADVFDGILGRLCHDCVTRFHTPLAVCLHPSNWAAFSRPHGELLVRRAADYGMPVWSFTQWCTFWRRRDHCRFADLAWHDDTLTFLCRGASEEPALRLLLPAAFAGAPVCGVAVNGRSVHTKCQARHGRDVLLLALPATAGPEARISVRYGMGE